MPTTETDLAMQGSRTERFAEYIRQAAKEAGYDIDSPRGGGKKALAKATGMTPSSVGRMLAGQTMPDPKFLETLASALGVSLPDLLVRSGVVSASSALRGDRGALEAGRGAERLTPAEAARRVGITSPARIAMAQTMIEHLLQEEQRESEMRRVG